MLDVELFDSDGSRRVLQVPDESIIGKGAQNEIRLDSWRIGREHARLFSTKGGVLVNGSRIDGQYGPLTGADMVAIGPCRLRVLEKAGVAGVSASAGAMPSLRLPAGPQAIPAAQTPGRVAGRRKRVANHGQPL